MERQREKKERHQNIGHTESVSELEKTTIYKLIQIDVVYVKMPRTYIEYYAYFFGSSHLFYCVVVEYYRCEMKAKCVRGGEAYENKNHIRLNNT